MDPLKVKIYSKTDCHLCEEAKAILSKFASRYPLRIEEVDIEKDSEAYENFRHEIPVVFLEDRKLFKYRIDEKKFDRALQSEMRRKEN